MFELAEKVAVVTGARRGMGKAHALALARQGAKVVVTDIDLKECEVVRGEIAAAGGEASCYAFDVSKQKEVDAVFDEIEKKYGKLDILVNNAGIFEPKQALDLTEAEWDRMLAVNLKGQFLCAQAAARIMKKRGAGRIVNISSIASGGVGVGITGAAHYTASKGGIIGMTESLAVEWAPLGITVNVIAPGAIDTPMIEQARLPKEAMNVLLAGIPMKRIGRPEEVAAAAVFLCSDEASYITGATLYVDGGWLAA